MARVTAPPSHIPHRGELVAGKYRVEGPLGEGGMSVVLTAMHEGLRQRVAMKILHPQHAASPELRERFFREARALAALHSEHVARVFDVGVLPSGAAFLVLELLDGLDLHQLLQRDGAIPYPRAVSYAIEACEGLREAHGLGILHRDLKPSNLFLAAHAGGNGVIKILDFGLAKLTEEGITGLTEAEAVMGSPSYMSPEQIKGLVNADARSDVWSLAVTLYELLSNELPFEGANATKTAAEVLTSPPISLSARVRNVPPGLEKVIWQCLVKDPDRRTASAAQLIELLWPFATGEVEPALFVPGPTSSSKPPFVSEQTMRMVDGRSREMIKKDAGEPTYGGLLPIAPPSDPARDASPVPARAGEERPEDATLVRMPLTAPPIADGADMESAPAPGLVFDEPSSVELEPPGRTKRTFAIAFGVAFAVGALVGLGLYLSRGAQGSARTSLVSTSAPHEEESAAVASPLPSASVRAPEERPMASSPPEPSASAAPVASQAPSTMPWPAPRPSFGRP